MSSLATAPIKRVTASLNWANSPETLVVLFAAPAALVEREILAVYFQYNLTSGTTVADTPVASQGINIPPSGTIDGFQISCPAVPAGLTATTAPTDRWGLVNSLAAFFLTPMVDRFIAIPAPSGGQGGFAITFAAQPSAVGEAFLTVLYRDTPLDTEVTTN